MVSDGMYDVRSVLAPRKHVLRCNIRLEGAVFCSVFSRGNTHVMTGPSFSMNIHSNDQLSTQLRPGRFALCQLVSTILRKEGRRGALLMHLGVGAEAFCNTVS
jgi:hypothetical protein